MSVAELPLASPSEEEAREASFQVAKFNVGYFIDQFGVIDNVQLPEEEQAKQTAVPVATMPFKLWPDQVPVADLLRRERRVLILKARQLGISWLVCGYVLHHCLFRPGAQVFLYSKGQDEANELIRRVKALYNRLPDWLKARLPKIGRPDNVRFIRFTNGATVRSMPATQNAGISYTASLVVLDEAAHMLFGAKLYENAKPIVDGGGQLIILSTANGLGGFFHNLWVKAAEKANSFAPIFLPWWAKPSRDQAWYDQVVADANDPALVPQNYPANDIEAFVASGRVRFHQSWIAAQSGNVQDPIPVEHWPPGTAARVGWPGLDPYALPQVIPDLWDVPNLRVYKPAQPGHSYVVAADVAEGKDPEGKRDPDYDAAVVLDEETLEEVAAIEGRWEPDVWGCYLMAISEAYNQAVVVVERNNHGHATLNEMKNKKFPTARVGVGHDEWPGWLSNGLTKPMAVDLLAKALRLGAITVRSRAALHQLANYVTNKKGGTSAAPGFHDDIVSAWYIGLIWIWFKKMNQVSQSVEVGGDSNRIRNTIGAP